MTMHTLGMLWFDNDPKTPLSKKIAQAVDYYRTKYQREPNLCLINPGTEEKDLEIKGMTVRPYRPMLPGHLWIGVEDD